jgi:hypothetical protein
MKPYRIKHIPTGLYYKPSSDTNLTKRGKAYTTGGNILTYCNTGYVHISLLLESEAYKEHKEYFDLVEFYSNAYCKSSNRKVYRIPISHFEKEGL